jgi:2'-5' RNA ligase
MTPLRAFIALEFPESLQAAIHQETASLREAAGPSVVRWVPAENMHLTLKFLGDVPSSNLEFINQVLAAEAAKIQGFTLSVGGLGAFPNLKRARVVWIGVRGPAELGMLQANIERAIAKLGYAGEERPFSPHLTIGRIKQSAAIPDQQRLRRALESTQIGQIGKTEIRSVALMRSELRPTGSIYTQLFSASLASTLKPEVKSESS